MNSLQELQGFYDETELAILYDWFEWPRPAPLQGIELALHDENDAGKDY